MIVAIPGHLLYYFSPQGLILFCPKRKTLQMQIKLLKCQENSQIIKQRFTKTSPAILPTGHIFPSSEDKHIQV